MINIWEYFIKLEATIRAAQEAAASANQERLKWQDKLNELEIQKNAIKEKENHLILKAKELQEFTQVCKVTSLMNHFFFFFFK